MNLLFAHADLYLNILSFFSFLSSPTELQIPELADKNTGTNNVFGNIMINFQTVAFAGALGTDACDKKSIEIVTPSHFNCTYDAANMATTTPQIELVLCTTKILCVVDNSVTGTQDVRVQLPAAFQKMAWDIQPSEYW